MNGSSVNVGIHDSTTNWYCIYINTILWVRRYAVTTSWIRVSDFNAYFSSIGTKTTKTTISALVSSCAVGDPVQLADKTTGTAYHTIIISEKDSSTAYFCGHTNSRNNVNVYNKEDYSNEGQEILISTSCGRDDRQRFFHNRFRVRIRTPSQRSDHWRR